MAVLSTPKEPMDITVKNLQSKCSIPVSKIQSTAQKVIHELRHKGKLSPQLLELCIVFVGEGRMKSINKKYLKHDYVTDVITFDLEVAAEIIICPSIALKNAKFYQLSMKKELLLYVIHGLLHLAGFDDHAPKDIENMRLAERQLLEKVYG